MLQALRQRLTLLLLCLLPFHAFLVTVLTKLIAGPNHAPLTQLAVWKEGMLAVILVIAIFEIVRNGQWTVDSGQSSIFDGIDLAIVFGCLLAVFSTIVNYPLSIVHFLYGFKYDFLPLIAFLILRRVAWSDAWLLSVQKSLLFLGVFVAAYGLLAVFLPDSFFLWLGYSDHHSLYDANGPLAAFQQLEASGIRRAQSVMSGPNQMGLWLLIPLGVVLRFRRMGEALSFKRLAISTLLFCGIFASFSRAAWIAAVIIACVAWLSSLKKEQRPCAIATLGGLGFLFGILLVILSPLAITRTTSSLGHLQKPLEAIRIIAAHPFGLGLGTAGPASNALSDSCIYLRPQDDPSWAKASPNLCVFVGGKQIQPLLPSGKLWPAGQPSSPCSCPLLTENWYLQWGVEMGWLGLALSVMLPFLILRKWKMENGKRKIPSFSIFLSFLGLSIAALFLHAFEDSAVAYTVWVFLAVLL